MAVLGLGLGVIGCGGPSLERSLADARESFAEADYPAAAIFLRNALQADGTNVDARLLMGEVSLQLGDLAGARNHLEWVADQGVPAAVYGMPLSRVYVDVNDAALALPLLDDIDDQYGDDARYWLLRSDALRLLGDYVGAASALARAEEQAAPRVEVSLRRAWLAFIDGERATAQTELDRALEADPGNARVYELRGRFAAETGDLAAAATDFETAVGLYRSANQPLLAAPMLMALVELRLAAGDMEAAQAAVAQLGAVAPGAPMTSYAAALVAVRAGRYEDAQANLRSALSGVPGEPRFLTLLGATHLALGNLGQAEQQFLLVLDRDRSNTGVLRMLVETRLRQDRAQSAVSAFSTFPAANDDNDLALLSLRARALLRSGDPAAAVRVIDRALTLSPDNQTLIMQQVEAQLAAGDPDAAAASLGLATDLTGDADLEASVQILIGRIREGGDEAGQDYVDELLAGRPDSDVAHLTAAFFYQATGDVERGLAVADTALRLNPESAPGYIIQGSLRQSSGDTVGARVAFDRALELAPENSTALGARALIAAAEQDYVRASDFFGRAFAVSNDWAFLANQAIASRLAGDADWPAAVRNWLSGQPQDLRAWMFLADQLRIARQAAAAIDAYEQVIALDAQNLMALNNAAYLASTLARPAAVDYARRALELAPDNPAVLDTLGWVLVQNSMPAEGLTYLMRATQLLPDLAEIQYHLGVAQLESGDPAAARESLNRALAGDLPDELRAEVERLAASI